MDIPHIAHSQWGDDFDLIPSFSRYGNGRLALQLYMPDGQAFGTISVNVASDQIFTDTEMFIKDYSENFEIVTSLMREGWLECTDRSAQSGFVTIPVMRLAGPLLEFYNSLSSSEVL